MVKTIETNSRVKRTYPEAFKRESVEYLIRSGKSCLAVARELGISDVTLAGWRRRFAGDPTIKAPDPEELTAEDMRRELKRLRQDNEYLKRQREILKKAMSILSEEPEGRMR